MLYYAKYDIADDGITITFPDLDDAISCAYNLEEAGSMAEEVLNLFLELSNNIAKPKKYEGQEYHPIRVQDHIAMALKLRWAREAANLTQSDIAQKLDISYQSYQRLENPAKSNATIKTIEKLQYALGVELISL